MTKPLLLVNILSTAILLASSANATSIKRSQFGQNAYPIWAPLSFYEKQTIGEFSSAQAGDADALLALYVLASGRYDHRDYVAIKKQVDSFVTTITERTDGMLDPWQQGELLNSAMHHGFFRSPTPKDNDAGGKPPSNYNLDQSAITGIFADNRFNCISSSLLYAVLLRHLNLTGQGVLLPSHAFIQLDFDGGKKAEVETTSPRGYDQYHDAEFYERSAEWFNPRGLTPSTYDDYLNRELVPLWQLGTRNMLHQHTHPKRMNEVDRGRLAEISAYLDPSYELAQNNRLHFYSTEAQALQKNQQWQDLARLADTVLPQLTQDSHHFSHNYQLYNTYFWLHLHGVKAYAELHNSEETLNYIDAAFDLAIDAQKLERAKTQTIHALDLLVKNLIKQDLYEEALAQTFAVEMYVADHPHYASVLAELYQAWSKHYWSTQEWNLATATLEDYLLQPYLLEDLSATHKNLSGAYHNWVITELKAGHKDTAGAILLQCESLHSGHKTCDKAKKEIKK